MQASQSQIGATTCVIITKHSPAAPLRSCRAPRGVPYPQSTQITPALHVSGAPLNCRSGAAIGFSTVGEQSCTLLQYCRAAGNAPARRRNHRSSAKATGTCKRPLQQYRGADISLAITKEYSCTPHRNCRDRFQCPMLTWQPGLLHTWATRLVASQSQIGATTCVIITKHASGTPLRSCRAPRGVPYPQSTQITPALHVSGAPLNCRSGAAIGFSTVGEQSCASLQYCRAAGNAPARRRVHRSSAKATGTC